MGAARRPPDRPEVLLSTFREVIARERGASTLIIGGKSLGGRIASMIADEEGVAGLVCLGYPFHPPGKPEKLRTAHLEALRTPALILQGERDPFGAKAEVGTYELSAAIEIVFVPDGDHSFVPRNASGLSVEDNLRSATAEIVRFATRVAER